MINIKKDSVGAVCVPHASGMDDELFKSRQRTLWLKEFCGASEKNLGGVMKYCASLVSERARLLCLTASHYARGIPLSLTLCLHKNARQL